MSEAIYLNLYISDVTYDNIPDFHLPSSCLVISWFPCVNSKDIDLVD